MCLIGAGLLSAGCGPTHRQTGEAALIVWPIVMLLAALPQAVLINMWRWRWPTLEMHWWHLSMSSAATGLIAVPMFLAAPAPWSWTPTALWLFGVSYLTVLLVATRAWIHTGRDHACIGPHVVASVVFIPFAALLRTGVFDGVTFDSAAYFVLPGYGGWVPGAVAVVLVLECWYRRRANSFNT